MITYHNKIGEQYVSENDSRITDVFKIYDKENRGYLLKEDFLNFYENAACRREETVWSNLTELGYGPDLTKLDASKAIITSSATAANKLPRFILTNNQKCFEFLFMLLSNYS